jgi:MFS family permease
MAAASASTLYFFITLLFVRETKPQVAVADTDSNRGDGGYRYLLRDHSFLFFCVTFTVMGIAYAQMMTIFPVYIKDQYLVPESQFGLIMATNAAMVVVFQYPIARILERYRLGPVLASGALFVGLGVGLVALSRSFPLFLLSMVIVTIGELIFAPSSTAFVAKVAPEAMRGRYMGVYGMTFGLAFGLGPVVGGVINDSVGPVFVWQIMAAVGLVSAVAFLLVGHRAAGQKAPDVTVTSTADASTIGNPDPVGSDGTTHR